MLPKTLSVLPHPPELFSFFQEKEESESARVTYESYKVELAKALESKPSTIVIVQSHGGIHPSGLSFHVPQGQQYEADFTPYSLEDRNFPVIFDQTLAHYMQNSLHEYGRQSHVIEQSLLSLPALLLADVIQQLELTVPRMIVLGVSLEGAHAHYEYGSLLARAIKADKDPISIVISGQMSHCLTKESVAGYVPIAKNYDIQMQGFLNASDWNGLMNIDPFEVQEVGEDLYRPLMMGLGLLNSLESETKWESSSYEAPHGIGYLCGRMKKND
jgi:aromatic ring-opening dioxygenase LigB subunit